MIAEFNPDRIKALVFDVDDTITRGTSGIKISVWEELFKSRLDLLQEARELYEYTGKGDRYNIIAYVIGEPQENSRDNKKVKELADKFEEMIQKRIRINGIHPDDLEALIIIKNNFFGPVYLLSATPEESVVSNIRHFESVHPELVGMFAGIIGTPMNEGKAGELVKIAKTNGLAIDEILMVGDGGSDYCGAKDSGSQFMAIIPDGKTDKWPNQHFPKSGSISDILKLLNI